MLPLQPSYVLADLAMHRQSEPERKPTMSNAANDPDHFFTETTALQPDPVSMTLREAITQGPIGRFVAWLDARAEAREERALRQSSTTTPVRFSPRREAPAADRDDLAA